MGTRENLKFFPVNDKVIVGELAHESLQVEPTLLEEYDIFVAHSLFGRNLGQNDAWPAFLKTVLEQIKLIVASLDLKITLLVLALDHVHDVTMCVLGISNREGQSFDIGEDVCFVGWLVISVRLCHHLGVLLCLNCFHHLDNLIRLNLFKLI